jgi:hypothetical protein
MDASAQDLLEQFVQQIGQCDGGSTADNVRRSEAYKALRARALEAFPHAVTFYRDYSVTTGEPVQEKIQMALVCLLVYLAKKLELAKPPPIRRGNVVDWVRWGRDAYDAVCGR